MRALKALVFFGLGLVATATLVAVAVPLAITLWALGRRTRLTVRPLRPSVTPLLEVHTDVD